MGSDFEVGDWVCWQDDDITYAGRVLAVTNTEYAIVTEHGNWTEWVVKDRVHEI